MVAKYSLNALVRNVVSFNSQLLLVLANSTPLGTCLIFPQISSTFLASTEIIIIIYFTLQTFDLYYVIHHKQLFPGCQYLHL